MDMKIRFPDTVFIKKVRARFWTTTIIGLKFFHSSFQHEFEKFRYVNDFFLQNVSACSIASITNSTLQPMQHISVDSSIVTSIVHDQTEACDEGLHIDMQQEALYSIV